MITKLSIELTNGFKQDLLANPAVSVPSGIGGIIKMEFSGKSVGNFFDYHKSFDTVAKRRRGTIPSSPGTFPWPADSAEGPHPCKFEQYGDKKTQDMKSVGITVTKSVVVVDNSQPATDNDQPEAPKPVTKSDMIVGFCDLHKKGDAAYALIKPFSPKRNRVWINCLNGGPYVRSATLINALSCYKRTGAIPIFCVAQGLVKIAMLEGIRNFCLSFAADFYGIISRDESLADLPLFLEYLNEPDHTFFENKDVKSYTQKGLKPTYASLKDKFGDKISVLGGNFSWNDKLFDEWADEMSLSCDLLGFHGYCRSLSELVRYDKVVDAADRNNKNLVLTEFGMGIGGLIYDFKMKAAKAENADQSKAYLAKADKAQADWPNNLAAAIKYVSTAGTAKKGVSAICLYPAIVPDVATTNSAQAVLDDVDAKIVATRFYDPVKQALVDLGII